MIAVSLPILLIQSPQLIYSIASPTQKGIFYVLPFATIMLAQTKNTIYGNITDSLQKPIAFTSVLLLHAKDSSAAIAVTADKNGNYIFNNVPKEKFLLYFNAVGFTRKYIFVINLETDTTYNVQLQVQKVDLQNVFVTAKKPFVQVRRDKIVLNVASSINAIGSSVFDLLRKAPGIKTAGQESLSINGKNGLAVYIDGNKVNVDGKDLIDYLQTLTSDNIETIEIITNPSAKYDAAGNGGIINIKTKKNVALGFNGTISINANFSDYKPKYNAAINLNYRKKNFNVYGNYSWLSANYLLTQHLFKTQLNDIGTLTNYDQNYQSKYIRHTNNYKLGADYFISTKSTIGFMVDGSTYQNNADRSSTTLIYQNIIKIDSQLISNTLQPKHNTTNNYNLNYRYKDSIGHELIINANYGNFISHSTADLYNNYETDTDSILRQANSTFTTATNINLQSINIDYLQKLWTGNVSAGVKFSQVNSNNNLVYYNIINNISLLDTGQTNQFIYKEKIVAGYFNYNLTAKKWQFQLGARVEHTISNGKLSSTTDHNLQAVDTNYTNLFPSVVIDYQLNTNNSLGLMYNKRIDRPDYQALNPFKFVLDDLLYVVGNPFLKPQFTSEVKLSHIFKEQFTTSLSYDNVKDFILNFRDTIDGGKIVQTTINLQRQQMVMLQNSAQFTINKWWDFNYSIDVFHEWMSGTLGKSYLNFNQTSWETSFGNTFKINKKWLMELSGFYNSAYFDAPANVKADWSVDVGTQTKILNDLGTLRLSISDLFNTDKFDLTRNFGGLYFINRMKWETRLLKLSFSYKFGNLKIKATYKKRSGAEDEQSRIKNGQ